VSQISPPIRIVLVAAVAFMGVYMMFLRPKDEVIPPADPAPNTQTAQPAVSEPGKVAESAQGAVDAANGQLQEQESVDGVDAGESAAATQTSTKPATRDSQSDIAAAGVDLDGVPSKIARAIRHNKTLVLLFWNGKSADDKAVHKALADVNHWNGRVFVASASINKISAYGRIARGVDVEQSPTVVVADSDLHAETLVGYVDAQTIDQAVVDAFRNTTGIFTDAYLKQVDAVCVHNGNMLASIPTGFANATSAGGVKKDLDGRLNRFHSKAKHFVADFKAIKAPKKWAAFKRASLADLNVIVTATATVSSTLTPKSSLAEIVAAGKRYGSAIKASDKRQAKRFDRENLFRCGSQF
jgi:hypothetical protein